MTAAQMIDYGTGVGLGLMLYVVGYFGGTIISLFKNDRPD